MDKGGFMENSPYAMLKDENGNYTQDPLMYNMTVLMKKTGILRSNTFNWKKGILH